MKSSFLIVAAWCVLAVQTSMAADAIPAENKSQTLYGVPPENVINGYTAKYVRQGYNVGQQFAVELRVNASLPGAENFGKNLDAAKNAEDTKHELIGQERKRTNQALDAASNEGSIPSTGPSVPVNHPDVPAYSASALRECAIRSLPLLKKLRQSIQFGSIEIFPWVNEHLDAERGDGKAGGAGGIACGKYMGKAGMPSFSWIEEIKLLSAISVRSDAEAEVLLTAFAAAYHPSAPTESTPFWREVWKKLGATAVFTRNPLPSPESLVPSYSAGISNTVIPTTGTASGRIEFRITSSPTDVQSMYRKGLLFAGSVMGR